ncbi:hypothetical protein [Alloalcanivorax gelatiniphagus]|uniref:DUF3347 domain-containing protein n=1 Tax=Alloalcanivorax gelatiniphagus TaxID=1194167 RepID=A0ABY2XN68_9GAMM|nr:hypothetical protein [Alloalcanivorax gelatiniphagus]TMW13849.1 hypothetical protein FGS76_05515 [Alloalcanivorax gelatiniphagus]
MHTLTRSAMLAVLLMPMFAQAAVQQADLSNLERELWQVRTNFHMYGLMDGDRVYLKTLGERISGVNDALDGLAADTDPESPWLADLRRQWQGFDADPDREPLRFDRVPTAMVEQLDTVEDAELGDYDDVHELLAHLQRITAVYTAIVAVNEDLPGEAESEDDFRARLTAFDAHLEQVRLHHDGDTPVASALKEAKVKWQFVRPSLVRFGGDAVPFLVYRYSNRIGADLEAAITP